MKMLIIGITGGTGCGKTTVVNQIIKVSYKENIYNFAFCWVSSLKKYTIFVAHLELNKFI